MDVQHDKELLFNQVYDTEHIPELARLSGVSRIVRYRTAVPHEPRYMVLYEVEHPSIPTSPEWKAAADKGRWAPEVRPYTMNRDRNRAVCTRVGGGERLLGTTTHLHLEALDVEPSRAQLLDDVYTTERLPAFARVAGVRNIMRYRAQEEGHPSCLTVLEIEGPEVVTSPAFVAADAHGRWLPDVLPYTYNRHLVLYERRGG